MFRYFAFAWAPEDRDAALIAESLWQRMQALRTPWQPVLGSPGLLVLSVGDSPSAGGAQTLCSASAVLLGSAFSRRSMQRAQTLTGYESAQILESRGRRLVESHWGSYVFIMHDRAENETVIVRGPMASLSCFWTVIHGVTLIFSLIEDCVSASMCPFSINWDCIRAQAVGGDYLGRHTALNELRTLLCGDALIVSAHAHTTETYWSPSDLAAGEPSIGFDSACQGFAQTVDECIGSWGSLHRSALLKLSGGLDSSVVLAALTHSPAAPDLLCVNFWSRGPGEERGYARSMTRRTGSDLVELERKPNIDLTRFLSCARSGNPPVQFTAVDSEPALLELARERKATAIFTGEIGDDILGHAPYAGVLAESLARLGWSSGFLRAAFDYALLTRVSLLRALSQAQRYQRWQAGLAYWSIYRYKRFCGMHDDACLCHN